MLRTGLGDQQPGFSSLNYVLKGFYRKKSGPRTPCPPGGPPFLGILAWSAEGLPSTRVPSCKSPPLEGLLVAPPIYDKTPEPPPAVRTKNLQVASSTRGREARNKPVVQVIRTVKRVRNFTFCIWRSPVCGKSRPSGAQKSTTKMAMEMLLTLIATLDFLVFNACSLGRHAAPGDLGPYKKGR